MKKSTTSSKSSTTRTDVSRRKLALSRQTLRHLTAPELAGVVGGTGGENDVQITDSCVTCETRC